MNRVRSLEHTLAYLALAKGEIDLTDAYSTDSKIVQDDLLLLQDDRDFFPPYQAVFLYRLNADPRLPQALNTLAGTLDANRMSRLNAVAERTRDYAEAAEQYFLGTTGTGSLGAKLAHWIGRHLLLVGLSLAASILLGVPLGIWASRPGWLGEMILGVTGMIQTVPSLALLALLVSVPFLGISPLTAIIALLLYGLLPIVRNTASGLQDIPRPVRESAEALGLEPRARLVKIFLPLASRSILAGIKTSAVINVGTATLAALIGAGGLGEPIISGLNLNDRATILEGAVPAALLALLVQATFTFLDRLLIPKGLRLNLAHSYTQGLLSGITVTNHINSVYGRDWVAVQGLASALQNNYGYDTYGRLGTVSSGNYSATYGYLPNSDLLQTTTCRNNSSTVLTTTRCWEYGMRLGAILNEASGIDVSSRSYNYDARSRPVSATLEDGSLWSYAYNDRDELISAHRFWSDWSAVSGQQFGYAYDNIGNRITSTSGGNVNGWNTRQSGYTVNSLDQYTSIATPGYKDVCGAAIATNSVTVNACATDRKSEYFHDELSIANSNGPLWETVNVNSGTNAVSGGLAFPANQQTLTYDTDGNLTFDGIWTYEWDGENRLTAMTMTNIANVPNSSRLRLEFAYDYQNRRVSKAVKTWTGSAFANPVTALFVYDGWDLWPK